MKRLFYILLFFSATSLAQELPESNLPETSNAFVGEFIESAKEHNLFLQPHLEHHLKGVYFLPKHEFKRFTGVTNDGRAGCLVPYHNYLMNRLEMMAIIDSNYLNKGNDAKAFLWHELGHFFGLDHDDSTPGIMNSSINGNILTEQNIELFFRKLKRIPPSKYRATINLN